MEIKEYQIVYKFRKGGQKNCVVCTSEYLAQSIVHLSNMGAYSINIKQIN